MDNIPGGGDSLLSDTPAERWLRLILEAYALDERIHNERRAITENCIKGTQVRFWQLGDPEEISLLRLRRRLEKAHAELMA